MQAFNSSALKAYKAYYKAIAAHSNFSTCMTAKRYGENIYNQPFDCHCRLCSAVLGALLCCVSHAFSTSFFYTSHWFLVRFDFALFQSEMDNWKLKDVAVGRK
jgi:hypothetical protein